MKLKKKKEINAIANAQISAWKQSMSIDISCVKTQTNKQSNKKK